jgi:TonB family protein
MKQVQWVNETDQSHPSLLVRCGMIAFFAEIILITAMGWHEHWLAHPQKTVGMDESKFITAEFFEVPEKSHLTEVKKVTAPATRRETVISKTPEKGAPNTKPAPVEEENQTDSGPQMAPSHGPVAVYAPPPILPSYMQDREIKTYVVIDFYVNSQGNATPHLAGSSGDEELDALALETVKKWQFRPAEKDHKPIEAKVRLRIVFEVQ